MHYLRAPFGIYCDACYRPLPRRFQNSPALTIAHSEVGVNGRVPTMPSWNALEKIKPTLAEHVKPVKPVKPVEPVESTEPVESVEPVKSVQPVERVEPIEPVERYKPAAASLEHPTNWKGAGGKFGLQADWRLALMKTGRNGQQSMKGEACLTDQEQEEVREILQRRMTAPAKKVWHALRTCPARISTP